MHRFSLPTSQGHFPPGFLRIKRFQLLLLAVPKEYIALSLNRLPNAKTYASSPQCQEPGSTGGRLLMVAITGVRSPPLLEVKKRKTLPPLSLCQWERQYSYESPVAQNPEQTKDSQGKVAGVK